MRFVTLNLDVQDARVVRQTVAGSIARCACQAGDHLGACSACDALAAVLADLDRLLTNTGARPSGLDRPLGRPPVRRGGAVALPAAAGSSAALRLVPGLGDA